MTKFDRRQALALLGAATVAGCAPAIQTGALGEDPFEGGIGGTGIVGLMVAAGSVLINGLRVEVPDATRIVDNGGIGGTGALIAGRAMTIVARARRDRLEAQRIDVEDPLIGVLRRTSGVLSVNGSPVTVEPGAVGGTLVGRRVAASGVWQADGSLRTSLIRPVPDTADSVSGTVTGDPVTGWLIGQTLVQSPPGSRLIAGQYASLGGAFNGTSLIARTLRQGRFRPGTTLNQLAVEGTLNPSRPRRGSASRASATALPGNWTSRRCNRPARCSLAATTGCSTHAVPSPCPMPSADGARCCARRMATPLPPPSADRTRGAFSIASTGNSWRFSRGG